MATECITKSCETLCVKVLRKSLKHFDSQWTRSKRTDSSTPSIAGNSRLDIPELAISEANLLSLNPGDIPFFSAARREFDRRVKLVEERVGHRFLHCD